MQELYIGHDGHDNPSTSWHKLLVWLVWFMLIFLKSDWLLIFFKRFDYWIIESDWKFNDYWYYFILKNHIQVCKKNKNKRRKTGTMNLPEKQEREN